jgi:quercetin dioxygenase-like cupin family protein
MGKDAMLVEPLLNEEQMDHKIGLYAKVTLFSGKVLENHRHHGETETYYILSGTGTYDDNGTKVPAAVGNVFFCKDGDNHGIECTSNEPLVFMALIIKK